MTDIVSVASNAVASYQRALGTVSNNIANVSTEGYSRQEAVLAANPVAKVGTVYLGTGVTVDTVKRQYDSFVETNLRNSKSDLASQEPMVNYANRVIDILGSSSMGLSSALDQFFNTSRDLSSDPGSTVVRGSFVRDADNLASRFGELTAQLNLVQQETDEAVKGYVASVNTIADQLADINVQLTKQKSVSNQPADLLDQRDKLLNELSSYAHLNTFFSANGSVTVSLGPSLSRDVIVEGIKSFSLGTNFNSAAPEKVSLVIDPYGDPKPLPGLSSGKLAGIMSFREQILGSSRNSLDTLANNFVKEVNAIHAAGIDAYGNPGTALFLIDANTIGSAGTMKLNFEDPLRVAAAAQFRIIENANNISKVDASLIYQPADWQDAPPIQTALKNNPNSEAAIAVKNTATKLTSAIATIPNGVNDVSMYLDEAAPGQQLQVFTRDGRQLVGAKLSANEQDALLVTGNGFEANAGYSTQYLNISGPNGYKGIDVFYGAKAEVTQQTNWDLKDTDPQRHTQLESTSVPALLQSNRIDPQLRTIGNAMFTLNGEALGSLSASAGEYLQASDLAVWLNASVSSTNATKGIKVVAQNEILIPASQIKLDLPLSLKSGNQAEFRSILAPPDRVEDMAALINAINAESDLTHVMAVQDPSGNLILTNTAGHEGETISIDQNATPNALSLKSGDYGGKIQLSRTLIEGIDSSIELGFVKNTNGELNAGPSDLGKIGFRTAAYIQGTANEDLLVFVTGAGTAKVSASYSGTPVDAKQSLRANPLQVRFDSPTHFIVTDITTGTVVADRDFDPNQLEPAFTYQGVAVSFSGPPKTGDVFTIDGNRDGTGNNENVLQLVDLESKTIMGGGKTFATAYVDNVNNLGNIARQASIAQSALQVVYDQSLSAHHSVAGVSLDEEAADLIRYQQAYQAAAKILQVASQLFDSVLQVR
jgi:flagellar hook-associated protein FlgK